MASMAVGVLIMDMVEVAARAAELRWCRPPSRRRHVQCHDTLSVSVEGRITGPTGLNFLRGLSD